MKPNPTVSSSGKAAEEIEKNLLPPLKKSTRASQQERIDEAIAESFPASDPPAWTAGVKKNRPS